MEFFLRALKQFLLTSFRAGMQRMKLLLLKKCIFWLYIIANDVTVAMQCINVWFEVNRYTSKPKQLFLEKEYTYLGIPYFSRYKTGFPSL